MYNAQNKNARIVQEVNTAGRFKTRTAGRDEGTLNVEISSKRNGVGGTHLFIQDGSGKYLTLDGFNARTLYRTLQEHFDSTGRTV